MWSRLAGAGDDAPRLSDVELLALAVAQVLLGIDTHRWMRFACCRLGRCTRRSAVTRNAVSHGPMYVVQAGM